MNAHVIILVSYQINKFINYGLNCSGVCGLCCCEADTVGVVLSTKRVRERTSEREVMLSFLISG